MLAKSLFNKLSYKLLPPFFSQEELKEMLKEENEETLSLAKSDDYQNFMAEEIINQTLKEFFTSVNEEFFKDKV